MLDNQEKNELYVSGLNALQQGETYKAIRAFIDLGDRELVKKAGDVAFLKGSFYNAHLAFAHIGDKKSLLKIIKRAVDPEFILSDYIGHELISLICANFRSWTLKKGFSEGGAFWPCESINIVYNLVKNYDIGIGIAHGGLFFGYLFEWFGLKVKIVDFHRKNENDTLRWIDPIDSETLTEKSIIVFDNDVRTGRTTGRVLQELKQYHPKRVDLAVHLNPVISNCPIGLVIENVPKGYKNVFYPKKFSYDNFDKAVSRVRKLLGVKKCQKSL